MNIYIHLDTTLFKTSLSSLAETSMFCKVQEETESKVLCLLRQSGSVLILLLPLLPLAWSITGPTPPPYSHSPKRSLPPQYSRPPRSVGKWTGTAGPPRSPPQLKPEKADQT